MYTFEIATSPPLFSGETRERFVGEVFEICGRRIARKNWGQREQIGCYVMVNLVNKLG